MILPLDTHLVRTRHIYTVADPGFPIGAHGPPTWALFGKNVCENKRIGSHKGGHAPGTPPRSANDIYIYERPKTEDIFKIIIIHSNQPFSLDCLYLAVEHFSSPFGIDYRYD